MLKKSTFIASLVILGSTCKNSVAETLAPIRTHDIPASQILSKNSNLNIAIVNQFDVGGSDAGLDAKKIIELKHKDLSKKLEETGQKLAKADSDFKNKGSMMSNSAREQAQRELVQLKNEHTNRTEQCELDLQSTMREVTESVIKEFQTCLNEVAVKENLDLVFDMEGKILYAKKDFDVTPRVVRTMNNKRSTKITTAEPKKVDTKKVAA